MHVDSTDLLRQLAGAGAIGRAGAIGSRPTASVEAAPFAELLRQASDGNLPTKLKVSVQSGAGLSLSDAQLARLSAGADRAEAAGLRTALVLIDGQRLVMDVHSREITGKAADAGGVVGGVDGLIDLGNAVVGGVGGAAAPGGAGVAPSTQFPRPLIGLPSGLTGNASLARLLQGVEAA